MSQMRGGGSSSGRHGDILVPRATPDEGYDDWVRGLATLRSFQTLRLTDREAADDPFVLRSIERADGLFIAGGDQSDYVRVWTGTPIQRAVNASIAAGVPVGGIRAGLAVLGGYAFTAERDTVTSADALADPFDDRVRLTRSFLTVPRRNGTITDSHFSERVDRGRLLVFMARTLADGWTDDVRRIGIDEETAVLLDTDGTATVEGRGQLGSCGRGSMTSCRARRVRRSTPARSRSPRREPVRRSTFPHGPARARPSPSRR
jgi:cyanophycinase-like exopeptidase